VTKNAAKSVAVSAPRKNRKLNRIFCLENSWRTHLGYGLCIEPMLELLQAATRAPFIHRDVDTRASLEYYLTKWCQQGYKNYPVLYLGFHGNPGEIEFGDGRVTECTVTLPELAEMLGTSCRGRLIYFGACDVLKVNGHSLNKFVRDTGVEAICGFRTSVDWIDVAALELIVLDELQRGSVSNLNSLRAIDRRIRARAGDLASRLQFHMVPRRR
jgi:hypothetical protein